MSFKTWVLGQNLVLPRKPLLLVFWGIAAFLVAIGAFALIFSYGALPPQVPLLFPAETGLAEKFWLMFVPVLAIFFLLANAAVSEFMLRKREDAAALFPAFLSILVSALVTWSLIRILRIFPLPGSSWEEMLYPLLLPFGGAVLLGFLITLATLLLARLLPLFLAFGTVALIFFPLDPALKGLLLGAGVLTIIQTVDDVRPLPFWIQGPC